MCGKRSVIGMSQPTPAQWQALLKYASAKLGVSEQELAKAAANGGYDGVCASLSESSRQTLEGLVGDPAALQSLLASPQMQELLRRFS